MSVISFDVAAFRAAFPEFSSSTTYPSPTLQMFFDTATVYINPIVTNGVPFALDENSKTLALNLMTAHLTKISTMAASGQTSGFVQSATVDKVTVGLTPPPNKNHWQWWLSSTPYGAQLLALLLTKSSGGFYFGGLPELSAFRKVGGIF